MENTYRKLIEQIGENPDREGLAYTPERAARAMEYLTQGYRSSPAKAVGGAIYDSCSDEMVVVKNIELYSLCEHHMLPFFGKCHVAYLPRGKVIVSESGISTAEHIRELKGMKVNAALVGEAIVTAPDVGAKVRELAG